MSWLENYVRNESYNSSLAMMAWIVGPRETTKYSLPYNRIANLAGYEQKRRPARSRKMRKGYKR